MCKDNDGQERHDKVDMPERASGYLGRVLMDYFTCAINVYRFSMLDISSRSLRCMLPLVGHFISNFGPFKLPKCKRVLGNYVHCY